MVLLKLKVWFEAVCFCIHFPHFAVAHSFFIGCVIDTSAVDDWAIDSAKDDTKIIDAETEDVVRSRVFVHPLSIFRFCTLFFSLDVDKSSIPVRAAIVVPVLQRITRK